MRYNLPVRFGDFSCRQNIRVPTLRKEARRRTPLTPQKTPKYIIAPDPFCDLLNGSK